MSETLLHFRSHGYLQTRSAMQSDERSCWNYPPSRYTRQRHPRTRFSAAGLPFLLLWCLGLWSRKQRRNHKSGLLDLTGLIWSGCTLRTWTESAPVHLDVFQPLDVSLRVAGHFAPELHIAAHRRRDISRQAGLQDGSGPSEPKRQRL